MPLKIIRQIGQKLFAPKDAASASQATSVPGKPPPAQPASKPRQSARARSGGRVKPAKADTWSIDMFQVPPAEGKTRFHDFNLPPEIMRAIADLNFRYCTPIQTMSLSHALEGRNLAGRAQTGTGKTAAFLIAILTRFMRQAGKQPRRPGTPLALILAPTRELVVQIAEDATALGRYSGLRCVAVYGGMDYQKQQTCLNREPVDLVVATPGRLLDFQRSKVIDLSQVNTLVIDEADRMLDMGFIPDVRRIVRCLPPREHRRTQLYSATLNQDVMRLASQWMPDPVIVETEPEKVAVDLIHQLVYIVSADEKYTILYNLALRYPDRRILVFCNRRIGVERLAGRLQKDGIKCEMLSGDVSQQKRMKVLQDFRSGKVKIVIATDVAGRGLHVENIGLVVNYELPYEPQDYIHRIGRTGRAGQSGTSVSFACEDESFVIPEIEKVLGEPLKCQHPEESLLKQPPSGKGGRHREIRPSNYKRPPSRRRPSKYPPRRHGR